MEEARHEKKLSSGTMSELGVVDDEKEASVGD